MSYTTYVLPFKSMLQNYQETWNEVCVLLASYHLFCFTEWIFDLNARVQLGWSLLIIMVINLSTNILILVYAVASQVKNKIK